MASLDRPVRIAYFGDSFIEADILTGDLREMLQKRFGGCGVGYVSITTKIAGFRPTVHHSFGGWSSHSVTDSTYFDRSRQDISNHYFIPSAGAYVALKGRSVSCRGLIPARCLPVISLLPILCVWPLRSTEEKQGIFCRGERGVAGRFGERADRFRALECGGAGFHCLVLCRDDGPHQGVVVDNFSTRGSSGQQLGNIPMSILRQYNRLRTYDLVVLQYGLNVASDKVMNYTYYKDAMKPIVERLKTAFPEVLS